MRLAFAIAISLLAACRCERPAAEHQAETRTPVTALPGSRVTALAALVPTPVMLYAQADDPAGLAARALEQPRVAALRKTELWRELAVTDAGAALATLRQRLSELAHFPLGELAVRGLTDGPAALALRPGTRGRIEWLAVKAIDARLAAAVELARALQSVPASEAEVRVERYRGLPLRKVRLSKTERGAYYVLRDRVVLGSDEAWVKASVDLATGEPGESAAGLEPVAGALARQDQTSSASTGSPDSSLRFSTGQPGLGAFAAFIPAGAASPSTGAMARWAVPWVGIDWFRLEWGDKPSLVARGDLPQGGAELLRLASRTAPFAVAFGIPARRVLEALDAGNATDHLESEARVALGDLRGRLAPALGPAALWAIAGFDPEPRPAAVHLFAAAVTDPAALESAAAAVAERVVAHIPAEAEPVRHRQGPGTRRVAPCPDCPSAAPDRVACVPVDEGLCAAAGKGFVAVSNRAAGVRAALAEPGLRPSPEATLAISVDLGAWASLLERASAARTTEAPETRASVARALAPFVGAGRITVELRRVGELHRGDLVLPR